MATKIQIRSCVIPGNRWSFFRGWEGVAVHDGRMSHGKWKRKLAAAWLGTHGGFVDEHKQTKSTHPFHDKKFRLLDAGAMGGLCDCGSMMPKYSLFDWLSFPFPRFSDTRNAWRRDDVAVTSATSLRSPCPLRRKQGDAHCD